MRTIFTGMTKRRRRRNVRFRETKNRPTHIYYLYLESDSSGEHFCSGPALGCQSKKAGSRRRMKFEPTLRCVQEVARLACVLVAMFGSSRSGRSGEPPREWRRPGTIRMAERLERLAEQANPVNNIFLNPERVKLLQAEIVKATEPQQVRILRYSLASELLDSGQNLEALHEFEAVAQDLKASNPQAYQRMWGKLKFKEALCWMRIGEITNCIADHNPESCLAPIQGRGIHRFQDGSRNAIQILTEILGQAPDNLDRALALEHRQHDCG